MNIKELNGARIKKDLLGVEVVNKDWHNKNKSGGNFGFTICVRKAPHLLEPSNYYQLRGQYRKDGTIYALNFGIAYDFTMGNVVSNIENLTYQELIAIMRDFIKQKRMEDKRV